VSLHLQPNHASAEFAPVVFGRSLGSVGNRLAWRAAGLAERLMFSGVNEIRADWGLPRTTLAATRRQQVAQEWPVLHGVSPHVLPRPHDWRAGLDLVGYWWPVTPADWTPPAELAEFLEAGPPPVFVGFGSSDSGQAQQISETVTTALRSGGMRGVIQAGEAGLAADGDDMLTIGDVPHEWLFPRTAAVVHAAGAGTTAAGLRAGVPAVPVPMTADQPFWASRLVSLGVSPAVLPGKRLTAERLAAAIRAAVAEPGHRERAGELAARLADEDGAARVLDLVAKL
jgi:UDP:flavonoid glycosyltransferase YjiC (YdhE family)